MYYIYLAIPEHTIVHFQCVLLADWEMYCLLS